MKNILLFIFIISIYSFTYAQETINFEFSYPENSSFIVEQHTDTFGTMKITGTPKEIEGLKKAGYNSNRKLKYLMSFTSNYETGKRTEESFPFSFYYTNIALDIDSDGKKQQKETGFPSVILKGNIIAGKPRLAQPANTGSSEHDKFINALPKYFEIDFPKVSGMKIGDSFITKRITENKSSEFSFSGDLKYTLTKIEGALAYFSIEIIIKSDANSHMKSSGKGKGEMIYNFKERFIQFEKMTTTLDSEQDNKTFKITAQNTIISSYELKTQK